MPKAMPVPSTDYHDYVIKDGRFIGAFNAMYRHCEDPWHQMTWSSPAYALLLKALARCRASCLLDLGCGLGAFTLAAQRAAGCAIVAIDLAPTALRKACARSAHAPITYVAADAVRLPFRRGVFDGVVAAELLWYVLPDVTTVLREAAAVLKPGGRLYLVQHFYQPEEQRYGLEIMRGPAECLAFVRQAGFRVISLADVDRRRNHKMVLVARKE